MKNEETSTKFIGHQPGDYTFRIGDAAPIVYHNSININGTLDAPAQFLIGKDHDPKQTHLIIENQIGKLTLVIGDTDPHTTHTITGKLNENPDLTAFKINHDTHRYDVPGFLRDMKQKRFFFADKTQHQNLISKLQSWSAKIETTLQNINDQKGNSNFQIEQKVRAVDGFVDKFDLSLPIFQGDVPLKFTVEIGLDPKNTSVQLYLFSDELFELRMTRRAALMDAALKEFDLYKFSKVVVS